MLEHEMKSALIDYLLKENKKNIVIGAEVPFLSGKRWLDVLLMHPKYFHAFEIKGDRDSLSRLSGQIKDINTSFEYTSVVVSNKYVEKISQHIPASVGIIYINADNKSVKTIRKPIKRVKLNKKNLSLFLWKQEIIPLLKEYKYLGKEETHLLRHLLLKKTTLKEINKLSKQALINRYKGRFDRFLSERGKKTMADDLVNLSFDNQTVSEFRLHS